MFVFVGFVLMVASYYEHFRGLGPAHTDALEDLFIFFVNIGGVKSGWWLSSELFDTVLQYQALGNEAKFAWLGDCALPNAVHIPWSSPVALPGDNVKTYIAYLQDRLVGVHIICIYEFIHFG